jgi:hypothetical protein
MTWHAAKDQQLRGVGLLSISRELYVGFSMQCQTSVCTPALEILKADLLVCCYRAYRTFFR